MSCASTADDAAIVPAPRDATAIATTGAPRPYDGILVVGLGNPILGDDGVGWRVAEAVAAACPKLEVACLALGGLSLMERLIGYERVIIVDALQTPDGRVGDVHHVDLADLPVRATGHTTAAHDTSLQMALEIGRALGAALPPIIEVVGVEARRVYDFRESLSPTVAAAIGPARDVVLARVAAFIGG